ncbi:MAG: nucleotidyltransferase domain-containing protein [Firmicutes bacterium]|jgi:predicted nucleotidyltransferase|nr:nucleotidyltransferase domain-containing protein [Bacillota bacterium]
MDVLAAIVSTIVAAADPDKIILFGSRACNDVSPDSDYDILVLKAGDYHKRKLAQELYVALADIPVPIDLVVEDPNRAEELRDVPGLIYSEALEGRVLYER